MSAESTVGSRARRHVAGVRARPWNSTSEISATAPPPTPLNSATICGIAVIFTAARADDADHRADRHPEPINQPK